MVEPAQSKENQQIVSEMGYDPFVVGNYGQFNPDQQLEAALRVLADKVAQDTNNQKRTVAMRGFSGNAGVYNNLNLPVRIGRSDNNDIKIIHDEVSNHHCVIKISGSDFVIDDESRNGTLINTRFRIALQQLSAFDLENITLRVKQIQPLGNNTCQVQFEEIKGTILAGTNSQLSCNLTGSSFYYIGTSNDCHIILKGLVHSNPQQQPTKMARLLYFNNVLYLLPISKEQKQKPLLHLSKSSSSILRHNLVHGDEINIANQWYKFENSQNQDQLKNICEICLKQNIDIILKTCGHKPICDDCYSKIYKNQNLPCLTCNTTVVGAQKVFYTGYQQ